jgi:phage-related minor tail protein
MSDLLAVFATADQDQDEDLFDAIAAYRPRRVTVLLEDRGAQLSEDSGAGEALRVRLAQLMATIEGQTGATVLGLASERSQLHGWRFDRELAAVPLVSA